MRAYLLSRLLQSLAVLFGVSIIVFTLPRLIASPAQVLLPPNATQAEVHALEKLWGLNDPLPVQYGTYLKNSLTGDFGNSLVFRRPALKIISDRFPTTLKLALISLALILPLGIAGGVLSAVRRGTPLDNAVRLLALIGQSVASFWLGIVLVLLGAVKLGWFPSSGGGNLLHYVLPALALSHFSLAALIRLSRTSMLEVLDSDFVDFARAKGLPEWQVVWKHALRNALITPITYAGFVVASLLTGSVIVETVFALPGVGLLAAQSIRSRDYAVVQSLLLLFAAIYVLTNLAVDMLYGVLDPRIRRR